MAQALGLGKLWNFIQETRVELKKVSWPTRQQVTTFTLIVLGIIVVMGVFVAGLDFVFTRLLHFSLEMFS